MTNTAIAVRNISKYYQLGAGEARNYRTLRESIGGAVRSAGKSMWKTLSRPWKGRPAPVPQQTDFWALRNVSFDVRQGEMIGVIGRNGAGKSTLLKILSRITEPTAGSLALRGHVGSLLEVGTGFHPELTGRENIYLNGAILGMTRKEIERKFGAIVDFAELSPFIDTPVKRYSSGMYVRLAFAVAAQMEPNILLLDEVLSVGDLKFQRKCMDHAKGLRDRNATVVFVSHNMFAIRAMCDRVVYLTRGHVVYDGPSEGGIERYEADNRLGTPEWAESSLGTDPTRRPLFLTGIETRDETGRPRTVFEHGQRIRVRLLYHASNRIPRANFVVRFNRSDDVACCSYSTALDGVTVPPLNGHGTVEVLTPPIKLVSEAYYIEAQLWDESFQRLYSAQEGPTFHVRHDVLSKHFGVYHETAEWTCRPH